MKPTTQVFLFGSLRKALRDHFGLSLQLDLKAPTPLPHVLHGLRIPLDMVKVAMVNFKAVQKDITIHPGDRLSLFPKEYPIFFDWKDLRF